MKALLDTHVFLWFVAGDDKLNAQARSLIEDPDNSLLLSIASLWEMAIKISLGKLDVAGPFGEFITTQTQTNGIALLPIEVDHLAKLLDLPYHHRDPFDRLLVAQCLASDMTIVSADSTLDAYGVRRVW
jgi:PIN domain nuclease of toxin-antitoxin system